LVTQTGGTLGQLYVVVAAPARVVVAPRLLLVVVGCCLLAVACWPLHGR